MPTATRHLGLIVILALLVGHASFAVHAASHNPVDVAECQLCISHGYSTGAVDTGPERGATPIAEVPAGPGIIDAPASRRLHLVRPRGPPSAD